MTSRTYKFMANEFLDDNIRVADVSASTVPDLLAQCEGTVYPALRFPAGASIHDVTLTLSYADADGDWCLLHDSSFREFAGMPVVKVRVAIKAGGGGSTGIALAQDLAAAKITAEYEAAEPSAPPSAQQIPTALPVALDGGGGGGGESGGGGGGEGGTVVGGKDAAQALLGTASAAGDVAGMKSAVAAGADVAAEAFFADGALGHGQRGGTRTAAYVCAYNDNGAGLRFLAGECGVDLSAGDSAKGWTPCHAACKRVPGNEGALRTLLALGADPNSVDHDGFTPCAVLAEKSASVACLLALVEGGPGGRLEGDAAVNARVARGRLEGLTALDLASRNTRRTGLVGHLAKLGAKRGEVPKGHDAKVADYRGQFEHAQRNMKGTKHKGVYQTKNHMRDGNCVVM